MAKSREDLEDLTMRTALKVSDRVARWFLFRPKLPIWVCFGEPWSEECCYVLGPLGTFYSHNVYLMGIGQF
jgi:hypothetical protein